MARKVGDAQVPQREIQECFLILTAPLQCVFLLTEWLINGSLLLPQLMGWVGKRLPRKEM